MGKIIDQNLYFPLSQATLTTPQKFNSVFDAINTNALGLHNYIPPSTIGVSTNFLYFEDANTVSPTTIVFSDTTYLPDDWNSGQTYQWTLLGDGNSSGTGYTISTGATASAVTLVFDGNTNAVEESGNVYVKLEATYTDGTNSITRITYAGLPFSKRGSDGADAIQATQALIHCTAPHQNLFYPDGHVIFAAQSKSLTVPGGSLTHAWTLHEVDADGSTLGTDRTAWIYANADHTGGSDATTASAYIKSSGSGVANKRFRLTLTVNDTVATGGQDVSSIDLYSYHHGTFFYAWNTSEVQAPAKVTLSAVTGYENSFFLPEPKGALKVKWGLEGSDYDLAGYIYTANGAANPVEIQAVLDTANLSTESAADYSLLRCDDIGATYETGEFINKYFWVHPMSASAQIIKKLSSSEIQAGMDAGAADDLQAAFGGTAVANTDHIYLIRGDSPSAQFDVTTTKSTIGPDAEKYFLYLTEWDSAGAVYKGTRDESAVVVSKGSGTYASAPAEVSYTFTDIYTEGYFKAEVVANKKGSYSAKIMSSGTVQISSDGSSDAVPKDISGVTVSTVGSSTLTLGISPDNAQTAKMDHTGYMIAYKEVAVTSSSDGTNAVTFLNSAFDASNTEWTVMFTNSAAPKLNGNIGTKLIGAVQAYASNGTKGTAVTFPPTSIQVDSSLDMTGLSKHLGRNMVKAPAGSANLTQSYPTDIQNNKGLVVMTTVFGRDIYIEQINFWLHDVNTTAFGGVDAGTQLSDILELQIQVEDQQDHKEVLINTASEFGVLKSDTSLSIPVPAGKEVRIFVNDPDAPTLGTAILGQYIEVEAEIFFAHAASDGGTGTDNNAN